MTVEYHPLANISALMQGQALDELVADFKAKGLVFHGSNTLDDRDRALMLGRRDQAKQPREEFTEADALASVVSKNLKRRHLNRHQVSGNDQVRRPRCVRA